MQKDEENIEKKAQEDTKKALKREQVKEAEEHERQTLEKEGKENKRKQVETKEN